MKNAPNGRQSGYANHVNVSFRACAKSSAYFWGLRPIAKRQETTHCHLRQGSKIAVFRWQSRHFRCWEAFARTGCCLSQRRARAFSGHIDHGLGDPVIYRLPCAGDLRCKVIVSEFREASASAHVDLRTGRDPSRLAVGQGLPTMKNRTVMQAMICIRVRPDCLLREMLAAGAACP